MEETIRISVPAGYYTRGEIIDILNEFNVRAEQAMANTRIDIIGQNGNTGEHYELVEDETRL